MIFIQKRNCYDCPRGVFAARLQNVKTDVDEKNQPSKVRLIFSVEVPWDNTVNYIAAKNYFPKSGKCPELVKDLVNWLGTEYLDSIAGTTWNPIQELGRPGQLILEHIVNDSHEKPFVNVSGIHKPGTLPLTTEKPEDPKALEEAA